ncbi:MAG TPA: efflux RND transporter permease subunit, partial [Pyrinomonadaceae bacterium]|nr:efflux RND transporter permease subunit [Pyrinomonadaceae bacterium]
MQKLAEICVRRPVFATMIILSLTVVGAFSFFSLGVDLFPKIDFPTITITVVNPGASPREIETEITDQVEATVNTISGIDELRSTSVEGVAQVFVQFLLDKDVDVAAQEIRDKVNLIRGDLPETAEDPVIQKLDTDASPILRIAVSADKSLREVTDIADKEIKERIESINGVGLVQILGGATREIHVWIDPDKMRAFNITVPDVVAAVRAQNLEVPGGRVDEGARELTVRTMGRITNPSDFNSVAVSSRGGYPVKVSDIGYVEDGTEEQRTSARLNGKPAVTLVVSKQSGQNSVQVSDAVKERLNELAQGLEKRGVRTQIVGDQSIFIKAAVESIQTHLIEGGLLAALVVFFFLWNIRSTLIAAIAIPTSIIATFGLMAAMDYTLNQITMLALTLMVGIVIDDAIVVLENIYRFIEEKGMPPFQAAIEGTREIGLAVMATTLSLLAVFIPVGFMGGIVGRFMSSFGLTSSFAIGVSLLVSFTLTPMLAARLIKRRATEETSAAGVPPSEGDAPALLADESKVEAGEPNDSLTGDAREGRVTNERMGRWMSEDGSETTAEAVPVEAPASRETPEPSPHAGHSSKESRWYRPIDRTYTWLLGWSMAHRWVVVLMCVIVIVSIVPLFMFVGKNFLPVDDQSQFEVNVRTPEGSTLAATSALVERIATDIRQNLPGVTDTLVTIGGGQQQVVNSGSIYVKLSDIGEREKSQEQMMSDARQLL